MWYLFVPRKKPEKSAECCHLFQAPGDIWSADGRVFKCHSFQTAVAMLEIIR